MAAPNSDRDILIPAIKDALARREEWRRGKTLLGSYSPDNTVYAPLVAAIERCCVYQTVAGHSLFSGYSGVVLNPQSLAAPLLYQADRQGPDAVVDAADWLIRMLKTRCVSGVFTVAIWGLSIDREVEIAERMTLLPFNQLPDTPMKRQVVDRSRKPWDGAVWLSQNFFDVPGAAIMRKVAKFPYIGSPVKSFGRLAELEVEARPPITFLQARSAGYPLVAAGWLEYDDEDLDFNRHENHLTWIMPEIVPRVGPNIEVDSFSIAKETTALWSLQADWRDDLLRSMKRFTLSQCRHQIVDQVVDLAIAFEIAMSGTGEGPMSWKAAVRSAQLIGGSLSRRQKNRRAIDELFKLRNKGAHGGGLKLSDQKKHEIVLENARGLYRAALASFLSVGALPDWKSLELEPRTRR